MTRAATLFVALALAGCPSYHAGQLPGTPANATFVDVDGVRVHYREEGQGPAVVLIRLVLAPPGCRHEALNELTAGSWHVEDRS